jgi:transposase InsO family protein
MDNGSQYLSEHFQNQIKFWGTAPSFAFVAQPETNGVVERFNETLKEQMVHGRQYRNAEELRAAVGALSKHTTGIGCLRNLDSRALGKLGKNSIINGSRRQRDS